MISEGEWSFLAAAAVALISVVGSAINNFQIRKNHAVAQATKDAAEAGKDAAEIAVTQTEKVGNGFVEHVEQSLDRIESALHALESALMQHLMTGHGNPTQGRDEPPAGGSV